MKIIRNTGVHFLTCIWLNIKHVKMFQMNVVDTSENYFSVLVTIFVRLTVSQKIMHSDLSCITSRVHTGLAGTKILA
jgi:hypothetical protein